MSAWNDVCRFLADHMTDRTPCLRCGKTGFVRQETVIDHGRSATNYYCGSCNQSWQMRDGEAASGDSASTADDRRLGNSDRRRSTRSDRRKP